MTTAAIATETDLLTLVKQRAPRERIAAFLDDLTPNARVAAALSLRGRDVGRLYRAVAGGPTLGLTDLVPSDVAEDTTVIFEGRNSLPTFSRFQKRFARMGDQIVGYNHQTMAPVTGPGFFVVAEAHDDADVPGELYFDYTQKPGRIPTGWPKFKPNESGLSTLVYAHMKDYMRPVAHNVMVGEAYQKGGSQRQFFILARV